jgi:hypothetical protein
MKRTSSITFALANLVLTAVLAISALVLLARFDATEWVTWPRLLAGMEWGAVALALFVLGAVPCATLGLALVDYWSGFRRQAVLSVGISVTLVLALVLWVGFGDWLATQQEARADHVWAEGLESMDAFLARYPQASDSEPARRLRGVAARLGLDLEPVDASATSWPSTGVGLPSTDSERRLYRTVRQKLATFVSAQTRSTDDGLAVPPPEVLAWLSAHAAGVDALSSQVREGGAIAFETDWLSARRPVPSLLGVRDVVCVLVLRALERERLADSKAAGESLEASWRIGDALRDRGEVISQLLAVGADSMTLGALRKLRAPPPPWQARIAGRDYSTSMLRALQGEAWAMSATMKRLTATDQGRRRAARGLWFRIEGPFMLLMASDFSAGLGGMVGELKTADPCRIDPARIGEGALARWDFIGRAAMPSLVRAWLGAEAMALEAELTRKVLAARELRDERGAWPKDLAGLESAVCRGARWDYSTTDTGTMSLSMHSTPSLGKPLVFRAGVR